MIVSQALGLKLFPDGSALGKTVYLNDEPATIIGVVDTLQTPWVSSAWAEKFVGNTVLDPHLYKSNFYHYVVRAQPGQLQAVMKAAQDRLFEVNRERVVDRLRSFTEVRADAYRADRALAVILAWVSGALLSVTAFGIVGLTSFWVAQRRRQIGVRRALGATRRAVLAYFQTENGLIAAAGVVAGVALAVGLNLWMMHAFDMQRLNPLYALGGALAVVLLGQFAVLWPPRSRRRWPRAPRERATYH